MGWVHMCQVLQTPLALLRSQGTMDVSAGTREKVGLKRRTTVFIIILMGGLVYVVGRVIDIQYMYMVIRNWLVILTMVVVAGGCLNYCEVENPSATLFTTSREIQQISLDKHIRGYNLDFQSSDQTVVQVFEPYHIAGKVDVTIKVGYSVVNIDGRNSNSRLWTREGIMFAQGADKNIAIGYGQFTNAVLPDIQNFSYFELPVASNCYSGLIFNSNLDVVIDCQFSTPNADQRRDQSCIITREGKLLCNNFGSVTKTGQRKSAIYNLKDDKFLISAALTQNVPTGFQNQTFINVFHILDNNVEFNLIIDRRTLGLDSLSITDLDIVQLDGKEYIVVSDAGSRIIMFRYVEANMVQDIRIINIQGKVQQFSATTQGTYLIATQKQILQLVYNPATQQTTPVRSYQLDPSDNQVTDLQSSYLFLSVRTTSHAHTYHRQSPQLRYLLHRQPVAPSTILSVSPFYPRLLLINSASITSISISQGYLLVSQVTQPIDIVITATSTPATPFTTTSSYSTTTSPNSKCILNIRVQYIQDNPGVYQKKVLASAYRLQSQVQASFMLTDYFGGRNLKYQVDGSSAELGAEVRHVRGYGQKVPGVGDGEIVRYEKIVEYDQRTYWLVRFTEKSLYVYVCKLGGSQVECAQQSKYSVDPSFSICAADGLNRRNGQAVFYWVYCSSPIVNYYVFSTKAAYFTVFLEYARFSDVTVGQLYTAIVEKQLNRITIMDGLSAYAFSYKQFTDSQLKQMGGFYPRQVFFNQNNPKILYVKFPTTVVTLYYRGQYKMQVLSIFKVSDQYIPQDQWQLAVGKQTVFLLTPGQAAQYTILADSTIQKLHSIPLPQPPTGRIAYQSSTNTVYLQYPDSSIQYIRLNQAAIQSQFYLLDPVQTGSDGSGWDVSGSWLRNSDGRVYYQYPEPQLVIRSRLEDSSVKEFKLGVKVSSDGGEAKSYVANVTAFNYRTRIQATEVADNGLVLPETGDNQTVLLPLAGYFDGPVARYNISCPYCQDGNIELITPMREISQNKDLGKFADIVSLEDNSGVLVLMGNKIHWVDATNTVKLSKDIPTSGQCTHMGLNLDSLIVFCSSPTNQQFNLFSVTTGPNPSITLTSYYQVPAQGAISKPSELSLYKKPQSTFVLVHDFDPMSPGLKDSTIKVFQLNNGISLKTIIDSTTFNTANLQPLNSMSVYGRHLLVTIGGVGLGYVDMDGMGDGQVIDLGKQSQLRDYTLDDTKYLRVRVYGKGVTEGALQVLVTTSNSLNYVISLTLDASKKIGFNKVQEKYNRYGHQTAVNWGLVDQKFVMLSYYNKSTSVQSIVLYKRGTTSTNQFYSSLPLTIPLSLLQLPRASLLHASPSPHNSLLFLNQPDMPASSSSLVLLNITDQFYLLTKYSQPSSFDTIKVTAINDYSQVSRDLAVQFENSSGGLRWYSVVIVIVLVLVAVGVAAGLYMKMRKRRADSKKVSLFTENQEIDQVI